MKKGSFNLLNGTFSVKEALYILMELYSNKITFHQRDVFSKEERNQGDVTHSKNRIIELTESCIPFRIKNDFIYKKISSDVLISSVKLSIQLACNKHGIVILVFICPSFELWMVMDCFVIFLRCPMSNCTISVSLCGIRCS